MSEALKPCPFCGSEASKSYGKKADSSTWEYVECLNCGAMAMTIPYWNTRILSRPVVSEEKLFQKLLDIFAKLPHMELEWCLDASSISDMSHAIKEAIEKGEI